MGAEAIGLKGALSGRMAATATPPPPQVAQSCGAPLQPAQLTQQLLLSGFRMCQFSTRQPTLLHCRCQSGFHAVNTGKLTGKPCFRQHQFRKVKTDAPAFLHPRSFAANPPQKCRMAGKNGSLRGALVRDVNIVRNAKLSFPFLLGVLTFGAWARRFQNEPLITLSF